jgi:3-isopropylmalate/(R)-2-methylmalate dehydratase large subunit
VLATGEIWLAVPETIEIEWRGRFGPCVVAKDVMLFLCAKLGMEGGRTQAVHFRGEAIRALGMQERMTLANMTAELGGQTGLVDPDETTAQFIRAAGAEPSDIAHWQSDADAKPSEQHRFDAGALVPQVAAPHSPANAAAVTDPSIRADDVAHIGACTGAKIADLRMAAQVLKGRKVSSGVALLVAPASRRDQENSGARRHPGDHGRGRAKLLPNAAACAPATTAGSMKTSPASPRSRATSRGRMGSSSARIYLGSPYNGCGVGRARPDH